MKRCIAIILLSTMLTCTASTIFGYDGKTDSIEITPTVTPSPIATSTPTPTVEPTPEPTPTPTPEPTPSLSQADIELIALVTMAEAEGESELGKRLVIDTILNRMDSPRWPNTVSGVVYQKSQFSSMWNGRVKRCYVREDICQLVREELVSRSNYDVVFFQMYNYSPYGKPLAKIGCHYFSSCK